MGVDEEYYDVPDATVRGIRTAAYKLLEHDNGERELYDLITDPREKVNVYTEPAYASIRADLTRRLDVITTCSGVTCCGN
ncbi:hypothetical protein BG844_10650 [Couchioplanes caeruleus subsp. caeruleus]|uniref:N-sulphoglucosamine sulphohydrolase C-terminal domain-containing protein n=1 Tax=Couchioplanes caeruleus subsp. caeruleus TaxID=56427 RepID=A0A1K0GAL2_9ACTN|nr:sulfatase/phosphatase domain-containing protein [Couchioplanes caeruleus]OJF14282.1 hypothetical protein BG844_10650 [Couchioplanes caeruleus subsp. caeruleus]